MNMLNNFRKNGYLVPNKFEGYVIIYNQKK